MSSSGAGRGRGWLNLAKNAEPPKPAGLSKPVVNNPTTVAQHMSIHPELIEKIKELNASDDGIAFNKKMHQIQTTWAQIYTSKEDVERSFEDLYKACLHDDELATKFVTLMASHTFNMLKINDCILRKEFLTLLQKDFDNRNELHSTDPLFFRNYVQMMGEYYNKQRLNGERYKFLPVPIVSCLELLLCSKALPDLALYAKQLFLYGSDLKSSVPEEIMKLSIKNRTILAEESQLVKEARLWLMLALELFNNRFGVFAPEVYKFYEEQLGSTVMINFQKPHDVLSIETVHSSKMLDSFQSKVNVLKISTSPTEPTMNDSQNRHFNDSDTSNSSLHSNSNNSKEKAGRPILGVGARFNQNKSEESNDRNNKVSGRLNKKRAIPKSNKGWEHDDRFENDYD